MLFRSGRRLVGSGRELDGQDVHIVDPQTCEALPPGRVGEIWVSGPSVAQGYWNRPEESQATFGAMLASSVQYFQVVPTYLFIPGGMLVILVVSFNLLGDAVRDALDPKAVH